MPVVLHGDLFRFEEKPLLQPPGDKPPRMIDNPVAGIFAVIFRHAKDLSHQPGILVPTDQPRDLAICGHAPFRYLLNDGKYFVYQVVVENTMPGATTPFP